jgi:hypothetical protein
MTDMNEKTLHTFTQEQLEALIVEAIEGGRRLERADRARANQRKGVANRDGTQKQDCMARLRERYRWMPHGHGPLISEETGEAVTNEAVYRDLETFAGVSESTAKNYVSEWRLKGKLTKFDGDVASLMEQLRRLSAD